jgi:hypothetical protein
MPEKMFNKGDRVVVIPSERDSFHLAKYAFKMGTVARRTHRGGCTVFIHWDGDRRPKLTYRDYVEVAADPEVKHIHRCPNCNYPLKVSAKSAASLAEHSVFSPSSTDETAAVRSRARASE